MLPSVSCLLLVRCYMPAISPISRLLLSLHFRRHQAAAAYRLSLWLKIRRPSAEPLPAGVGGARLRRWLRYFQPARWRAVEEAASATVDREYGLCLLRTRRSGCCCHSTKKKILAAALASLRTTNRAMGLMPALQDFYPLRAAIAHGVSHAGLELDYRKAILGEDP